MKKPKLNTGNILFLIVILLLIIPQTRQPIQVFLNKGLALIGPSVIETSKREKIANYNWELVSDTGETYHFTEAKDKVVVINFWATWCPPCIAEMPSLDKLYKSYKNDVVFLFVSNESVETISKFKSENTYGFKVYAPKTVYPEPLDVSTIPRTYVLDKNGNIVIDKTGAANWNSQAVRQELNRLLKD